MTHTDSNPILIAKRIAGKAAADLIQEGMLVGLGTGSTTAFFIEELGKRCQSGLNISAVATSLQSGRHANQVGIPMRNPDEITFLDVTVDGADEIDHKKNMIKGGGGALLREKLLAKASREMIVIIDETKLVEFIGNHPLPIEIVPFVYRTTIRNLEKNGYHGELRLDALNQPFITDNGNYIFDVQYSHLILDPKSEHEKLKMITGVIETGLFFDIAQRIIIGYLDGYTKIYT